MPQTTVPEGNDDRKHAAPEASAPEREASFPPAAPATPRFHELDALRATAMLLGIVLHAFLFLIPKPGRFNTRIRLPFYIGPH